jgi:sulfate transporter 3
LASIIISTLVVFLFKAQNHGISIVRTKNAEKYFRFASCICITVTIKPFLNFWPQIGQLKCGLNRLSWDKLIFDTTYLELTMKTGLVTGIISLTV